MKRLFKVTLPALLMAFGSCLKALFWWAAGEGFAETLRQENEAAERIIERLKIKLEAAGVLGMNWRVSPPSVEWRMREGGNVNFSGYTVCGRTYPGRFVLMSRDGRALWNERSYPVTPPAPGLVPKRLPEGWVWSLP